MIVAECDAMTRRLNVRYRGVCGYSARMAGEQQLSRSSSQKRNVG
jgi:hypothetical protein